MNLIKEGKFVEKGVDFRWILKFIIEIFSIKQREKLS